MKYNNFRTKAITINEANLILEVLQAYKINIVYIGLNDSYNEAKIAIADFNYSRYAIVKENDTNIWIETRYYEWNYKPTRYICWLDNVKRPAISGLQAFQKFQQHCFKAIKCADYGIPKLDQYWDKETRKYACSASPLIGYNPEYQMQELHDVWEYDINSAYSSIMLTKIPNVNHPYFDKAVKKNQVGFYLDDKLTMTLQEGSFAQVVFDLIELDEKQKKYIEDLYLKKEMAHDDETYNEAKLMANAAIGYYQKYNPFVRSYVVNMCNRCIRGIINSDTLLWNTDAIISLKRRPELELGAKIGQFKEIHINKFVYKGNNYQIDDELPKYRGVAKSWFPTGWNMLTDPVPKRDNSYVLDTDKYRLQINKEHWR